MARDQKILIGAGVFGAVILAVLLMRHPSGMVMGVTDGNGQSYGDIPAIAPVTPRPYILPAGGGYISPSLSPDCGCGVPGGSLAASGFLPASASSFATLVGQSGIDPSQLSQQVLDAMTSTDFTPQTSDLTLMQYYGTYNSPVYGG